MSKSKLSSSHSHGTTVSLNANRSTTAIGKILFMFTSFIRLAHSIPVHINSVASTAAANAHEGSVHKTEQTPEQFYINLFTSAFLVLAGGVFAGLTLGLMGQDEVYLKVISSSGEPSERKHARKVLRLLGRGKHWVLVTLLLSNVITNETLPIVLDRCLGGGWPAVVTSTVSIVIFGEIIPQSICVRYGLQVGALFSPFVLCLMYLMYPVAYPCALLLDHILGEDHGTVYKKSGLKTLVTLHKTMGVERLNQDEVTIISAVLDLKEKSVSSIMTPMDRVYTMSADTILDEKTVEEIFNAGFSRIPIHLPGEPDNFIGMFLVRVLISYDPEDALPVATFPLATLPETGVDTSCLNILNYFQEGKSHMIIISETPGEPTGAIGVLTLEDVIEELIGEEIVDESDVYIDINKNIKRKQPGPLSKRHLTSYLHNLYQRGGATSSKRNSLESQDLPPDLRTRLERQGSQATVISSTPKNKGSVRASDQESTAAGATNGTTNTTTPGATGNTAVAAAAAGAKWKIQNPAMNPLETSRKFVTIKKPDHGKLESVAKAASPAPPAQPQSIDKNKGKNKLVGQIHTTEQGAIDEAQRRSVELRNSSEEKSSNRFLLPTEREADVSELPDGSSSGKEDRYSQLHHDGHINIPIPKASSTRLNGDGTGLAITEHQESRSYRTGGIIESVVNVDGVHKTIIENVSDHEDEDGLESSSLVSEQQRHNKKHKQHKKKKPRRTSSTRSDSFSMSKFSDDEESVSLLNGSGHSSTSDSSKKKNNNNNRGLSDGGHNE
ncbi:MAM3 [Candida margitis]|uniref:MAM3 n=1 Tax=Candida margitis TaxID=1775924 RepID=UPI002226E410|nr:MAM3 [Candida margitis]KAI5950607.1 MAM3 [Candida margitis]